jgi:hypothetical protein
MAVVSYRFRGFAARRPRPLDPRCSLGYPPGNEVTTANHSKRHGLPRPRPRRGTPRHLGGSLVGWVESSRPTISAPAGGPRRLDPPYDGTLGGARNRIRGRDVSESSKVVQRGIWQSWTPAGIAGPVPRGLSAAMRLGRSSLLPPGAAASPNRASRLRKAGTWASLRRYANQEKGPRNDSWLITAWERCLVRGGRQQAVE